MQNSCVEFARRASNGKAADIGRKAVTNKECLCFIRILADNFITSILSNVFQEHLVILTSKVSYKRQWSYARLMKSDLYFVKGNIYKCTRILVDEKIMNEKRNGT